MLRQREKRFRVLVCVIGSATFFLLFLLSAPRIIFPVHSAQAAQAVESGINLVQEQITLTSQDPRIIVAKIIRVALGLLGLVALLIVLWGGFQWMTSQGEEDKITDAKRTLINGAIGLAIILSAFAITQFVLNSLIAATGAGGGPSSSANITSIVPRSGSLGQGIIEMHYPPRGATDVPRNVKIIISFKKPIKLNSLISGYDDANTPDLADDTVTENLNTTGLKIYKALDGPDQALNSNQVKVHFTPDRKTFIFAVTDARGLGSDSSNILYTVDLPSDGLRLDDGTPQGALAFVGDFSAGYIWQFETGTFYDFTPPTVTDYFPYPSEQASPPADSPKYPRNVLIQINFNEAIDPTSIVGRGNIAVTVGGQPIEGVWNAAINNYRTAEFTPTVACGTNSCGETVYCLPSDATIDVHIRAADLINIDSPQAAFPYTGITDVCGNSLNDQGNNATAEGSPTDDVAFGFGTSSAVDLTAPVIESVSPRGATGLPAENIAPNTPVTVMFSKIMSRGSINTSAMRLFPTPFHELWYTLSSQNFNNRNEPVGPRDTPTKTGAAFSHGLFVQVPIGVTPQQGYVPAILSGVRDVFQNCFVPSAGPGADRGSTVVPNGSQPYVCNGDSKDQPLCGPPLNPGAVNFSR